MYRDIQSYKQMGYSQRHCARELKLDRKTVRKYWDMREDTYVKYLAESRKRSTIMNPYREEITAELEQYPNITTAIIIDHLKEKHPDFIPSERSVRLYVSGLREELGIPTEIKIRQYTEVSEHPPGRQAQVDMGQKVMSDPFGKKVKIYIFAMVMSCSRKKFVYFQDHPFNAAEFVTAHDLAFRYYGGRTDEIVYDQDRVMAVSENAGDLILTETFETYRKYAGFGIYLCRASDPQSKGKIESVIKYTKNNFLSCRIYHGISSLNSDGLKWLDRTANAKIHDTTKLIPDRVFAQEARYLKPVAGLSVLPEPKSAIIRKTNVVHFKQNRYEVPKGTYFPGRKARIELDEKAKTVCLYDKETGELFATHPLADGIGKLVRLAKHTERYRKCGYDDLKFKVLEGLSDIKDAENFIIRIIEAYPRYARDQLRIMKTCVEKHSKDELKNALNYCVERDLISATDFRDTLEFFRTDEPKTQGHTLCLSEKYQALVPQIRSLDRYASLTKGGEAL